jgi:SAM-dependent methyltransferase
VRSSRPAVRRIIEREKGCELSQVGPGIFDPLSVIYPDCRPSYPDSLFRDLVRLAARRRLAFDAASGTGQSALRLASWFDTVVAVDQSPGQIREAKKRGHPANVDFRQARAEASGLENDSVDLVTCAQAVHWLSLDEFYGELERVLRRGGVFAVWGFTVPRVSGPIDRFVRELYNSGELWPYWAHWRPLLDGAYRGLRLPFGGGGSELRYKMREMWRLGRFQDYLRSWPAVAQAQQDSDISKQRFIDDSIDKVASAWGGDNFVRAVEWDVFGRVDIRGSGAR